MSRYGIQAGGETVFNIKNPLKAIELVKQIIGQWNGAMWTQHRPRCPLCNDELKDCEQHMNQPVGECDNKKCESRIYAADYFGKIQDILDEWGAEQESWVEEMEKQVKRAKSSPSSTFGIKDHGRSTHRNLNTHPNQHSSIKELVDIDEEEIFIW